MSNFSTHAEAGETIIIIPHAQLHDSKFQYRQRYNEATIAKMAETMKPPGGRVQQPIIVREIPTPAGVPPELAHLKHYDTAFGHRRRRAALLAGLAGCPAIVRVMTDEEVRKAQLIENIQREDVHPIEEAEGFQALIKDDGYTADQIAEQIGKSRSHVYGRLQLLQACAEVRKACLNDEIGAEAALLVARLRTEKLQQHALARIKSKYFDMKDGGKRSFRQIRDLLSEHYTLDLSKALFKSDDADLLPDAGACTTCPKRAGNAPEYSDLVEDHKSVHNNAIKGQPNLCTDPDCFEAKKKAQLRNEAAALTAKGEVVIEGNKARAAITAYGEVKGAYVALADVKAELKKAKRMTLAGKPLEECYVVIQDPRTGKTVKAMPIDALKGSGVKVAEPKKAGGMSWEEQNRRNQEERKRNEEKAKLLTTQYEELLGRVREVAATRPRDAFDLQLVARVAFAGIDYYAKPLIGRLWGCHHTDLAKKIGSMNVEQLTRLMLDCALVNDVTVQAHALKTEPKALYATAAHYGVEIASGVAVQTSAKPAPTPSTAAPAAKKAAGGKNVARYRNAMTGETWSGRGLQPKWLKVAISGGAKLADFEVPTPSKAAPAAKKAGKSKAPAAPASTNAELDLAGGSMHPELKKTPSSQLTAAGAAGAYAKDAATEEAAS